VKNNGIVPQYYVKNSYESIIPREIFMKVQEELVRRRIVHTSLNRKSKPFSSTHCFSNITICGAAANFSVGYIGTTEVKNRLSGGASVGSKTPANSAMPGRYLKAQLSKSWLPP